MEAHDFLDTPEHGYLESEINNRTLVRELEPKTNVFDQVRPYPWLYSSPSKM